MSFSADTIQAKLSSLNELQETVVAVAQWLLFHKRHAPTIADLWLKKVQASPPAKRLGLVYLVNEVAQQAKIRKKDDFEIAFTPKLVEGLSISYKSATLDIQQKLRRTVQVWRERAVFNIKILDEIEVALNEIDLARASTRKAIGGSIFSNNSSVPSNFQPIFTAQTTLSSAEHRASSSISAFEEAEKGTRDVDTTSASLEQLAPLSANLSSLLQKLSAASVSVAATIDARQILLSALAKLTEETKASLKEDEKRLADYARKKNTIEKDIQQIEDLIQRGENGDDDFAEEPTRPDAEPLTPPPVESLTPPGEPTDEHVHPVPDSGSSTVKGGSNVRSASDSLAGQLPAKRRKLDVNDEFAAFAGDKGGLGELDPDVEAMLAN